MGIAANKNISPEVIAKIRLALITLKANGVYEKLQRTWFTPYLS